MEKLLLSRGKQESIAVGAQAVSGLPLSANYPTFAEEKTPANFVIATVQFLRRWKWVLITGGILGTLVGLVITLLQPTLYQARASLEIQDLNDTFLNVKQFLPVNESGGPENTYGDLQTQIKILQSESLLKSVRTIMPSIEASALNSVRPADSWARELLKLAPLADRYVEIEAKRLADNLEVRAVGQTRIIELTAKSTNPRMAADFLNQLCAAYIERNMKARYDMGRHTSESLSRFLQAERIKLRESEDALQEYARSSGLMFTGGNKSVAEEKLRELQDELSKAEETRIGAQSRYETAKESPPDGLPDDLSEGSVRDYRAKLTQLRQQVADLATTYTSDYFKIRRVEAQISALESAVQQEQRDVVRQAQTRYAEALRRENLLSSRFDNQSSIVTDLGQRAIQYNMLEQEVEGNRQGYNEMLKQVKEATVAAAVRTDNIRVVDAALPPTRPATPKARLNCALGLLLGSFSGLVYAFIRERTDSSFREPGDGLQYLGVAELGAIIRLRRAEIKSPRLAGPFSHSGREFSGVVESYRAIVTSLLSETNMHRAHLLVVTSPGPNEGKTTVTANLGVMLSSIGRRVLLVDGDTRKQRLGKLFGLKNDQGLSTLLRAAPVRSADLNTFVQETSRPGLFVLTSGPSSSESVNLLHSAELEKIMGQLKSEYDFVLIDTPPVLPVADARVIGGFADGVIFVVHAGRTTRHAATAAYQRLAGDGIPVTGMILNAWDPRSSAYRYYAEYPREYRTSS